MVKCHCDKLYEIYSENCSSIHTEAGTILDSWIGSAVSEDIEYHDTIDKITQNLIRNR